MAAVTSVPLDRGRQRPAAARFRPVEYPSGLWEGVLQGATVVRSVAFSAGRVVLRGYDVCSIPGIHASAIE